MSSLSTSRRNFIFSAAGIGSAIGLDKYALAAGPTDPSIGSSTPAPVIGSGNAAPSDAASGRIALAPPDKQPENLPIPGPPLKQVGWAIVGLGDLALGEIMPAFADCQRSRPVALVSGHPNKAKKVAQAYGIAEDAIYNYENYDRLANDPRVDVIYIVLPNSMHAEFTIRGLQAGKHVLCEKPMSATVAEAEAMIAAAKKAQRHLMVAYRLHYEPFNQKAMELCQSGAFGKIKTFASHNSQNVKAPNIRLSRQLAGGPLGDVGVYSINAARYILNEEPVEVFASAHQPSDDPRFAEVPESVVYTMKYPSGALAHCGCSFGSAESRFYQVQGTTGSLRMDPAFSYRGLRLHVKDGNPKEGNAQSKELMLDAANHFAKEMDHFSAVVAEGESCHTPGEMGLADMKILAALEKSWRGGQPVKLS